MPTKKLPFANVENRALLLRGWGDWSRDTSVFL